MNKCSRFFVFPILLAFFIRVGSPSSNVHAQNNDNSVIIVGGGASGLTAARKLKENGVKVTVLEGRDRLGGRIHTVEVSDEQPSTVDLGAAWIHGASDNNYLYDVAMEGGLEVVNQGVVTLRYFGVFNANSGFEWFPNYRVLFIVFRLTMIFTRLSFIDPKDGSSLEDRLDCFLDRSSNTRKVFQNLFEVGNAARLSEQAGDLSVYEDVSVGQDVMIHGGFAKLIEYLSQPLSNSNEVLLNKTVTDITVQEKDEEEESLSSTTVIVETSDGSQYEANYVIVTVPLGVLKTDMITFNPPLPQEKVDSIEHSGYGFVERIVLTFKRAFWRKNPEKPLNFVYLSNEYPSRYPYFVDCSDTAGSPTIFALVVSEVAEELADDPDLLINEVQDILNAMYPNDYETPVGTVISSWFSDPFARGSYYFPSITANDWLGDIDILAQPIHDGHVLFAGEATSRSKVSTVEGAMLSGLREADRIISLLR